MDDDNDEFYERTQKTLLEHNIILVHESNSIKGFEQLRKWSDKGIQAEFVSIDYNIYGYGNDEINGVTVLSDWLENKSDDQILPKKFFIQSANINFWKKAIINSVELSSIEVIPVCTGEWSSIRNLSYGDSNTHKLKEYLEYELGLPFEESWGKSEYEQEQELKRGVLPLRDLEKLKNKAEKPELILSDISHYDYRSLFETSFNLEGFKEGGSVLAFNFSEGSGQAVTGHIALNKNDIIKLQKQGKSAILLTEEFDVGQQSLIGLADGAIVISSEGDIKHINQLFKSANKPVVIGSTFPRYGALNKRVSPPELVQLDSLKDEHPKTPITTKTKVSLSGEGGFCIVNKKLDVIRPDFSSKTWYARATGKDIDTLNNTLDYKVLNKEWLDVTNNAIEEVRFKYSGAITQGIASNPQTVNEAISLNTHGIGLYRTEDSIIKRNSKMASNAVNTILLSNSYWRKRRAKKQLSNYYYKSHFQPLLSSIQEIDFSFPLNIRLFDADPKEYIRSEKELKQFYDKYGYDEFGHRGIQLALKQPLIYQAQMEALAKALKNNPSNQEIYIKFPTVKERAELDEITQKVLYKQVNNLSYNSQCSWSAMIETKESVENIIEIARFAPHLSFGGNDLTAAYTELERGKPSIAIQWALNNGLGQTNPFSSLVPQVIEPVKGAIQNLRDNSVDVVLKWCGSQASDIRSVKEFLSEEMDFISVPVNILDVYSTRLASAKGVYLPK